MGHNERNFDEIIALAKEAESLNLDSIWVGDSILARPRFDPVTTLAAVAARTECVRIGSAVILSALRNPVVLANEMANVDLISQGRLILGLGTAARNEPNRREFESIGIPFPERIGIFDEGVDVMQRLWRDPKVTYEGRHFKLDDVSLGLRPYGEKIPVWFSASEDRSLRRVLQKGDGWLMLAASAEAFHGAWIQLQEMAADAGRDVSDLGRAVYVTLDIDHDAGAAMDRMRSFIEGYYGGTFEELTRIHAVCAGSAEACAAWLQQFIEAGVNTLIVRFNQSDQAGQLRSFAEQVMPLLRS
jgi:alkanesulfonate monooxygenase SsuD/methylene tetrahydromethanopterin reductase-like flavin-dependent oxidoreductase (luciferase family)